MGLTLGKTPLLGKSPPQLACPMWKFKGGKPCQKNEIDLCNNFWCCHLAIQCCLMPPRNFCFVAHIAGYQPHTCYTIKDYLYLQKKWQKAHEYTHLQELSGKTTTGHHCIQTYATTFGSAIRPSRAASCHPAMFVWLLILPHTCYTIRLPLPAEKATISP